jgi:hypothetical protein
MIFMQRYFQVKSMKDCDIEEFCLGAILLAGKTEENSKTVRRIISAYYTIKYEKSQHDGVDLEDPSNVFDVDTYV